MNRSRVGVGVHLASTGQATASRHTLCAQQPVCSLLRFDNVYVDEEVRIAKDVRNDVLVVERDGPPRIF